MPNLDVMLEELVTANRILARGAWSIRSGT
jgi:hypothetical protein